MPPGLPPKSSRTAFPPCEERKESVNLNVNSLVYETHMSIGWQTPEQAHSQCGEQLRCWKNYLGYIFENVVAQMCSVKMCPASG